jgi:hypothetical protein
MAPPRVTQVEGELVEFLSRSKRAEGKPKTLIETLRDMGKQDIWSQLEYKIFFSSWSRGCASHLYKDIFGVWPVGLNHNRIDPTYELEAYIRQRNIAYAKAMQKRQAVGT